ncbi:MAG: hypothetical protein U1F98_10670 [Verrucomicrobiota bacterium]
MKIQRSIARFFRGLTLVETMITMFLFSFVVLALVYTHIFGLKQDQLIESKLGASDESRKAFERMSRDVRSSQDTSIGTYSGGTYSSNASGVLQIGNALKLVINVSNPTNIIYYFDTSQANNYKLMRIRTGESTATVMASNLINNYSNSLMFMFEDQNGNIISDLSNRRIVHCILQFLQYQYPTTTVGNSNSLYDFYKMEFRVTPHVPQGR